MAIELPEHLKLPRVIENEPEYEQIKKILWANMRPLWHRGTWKVPHLDFTPALEKALLHAKNIQQIERGLEDIERVLAGEAKGIDMLRKKQGGENPFRLSRFLIVSSDGSERFYRQAEEILKQHGDRVVCLWLGVSTSVLAKSLFGEEKIIRAILVSDRDSVSGILRSLV